MRTIGDVSTDNRRRGPRGEAAIVRDARRAGVPERGGYRLAARPKASADLSRLHVPGEMVAMDDARDCALVLGAPSAAPPSDSVVPPSIE